MKIKGKNNKKKRNNKNKTTRSKTKIYPNHLFFFYYGYILKLENTETFLDVDWFFTSGRFVLYNIETYSFGERTALTDGDDITNVTFKGRGAVD